MSAYSDVAGIIACNAYERAARAIVLGIDENAEEGRALKQLQQVELVRSALQCFDGLEAEIEDTIRLFEEVGHGNVVDRLLTDDETSGD